MRDVLAFCCARPYEVLSVYLRYYLYLSGADRCYQRPCRPRGRLANTMEKRIAVCPGSFDPITLGHLDIIRRAAGLFDQVIVAVARDARKSHMLSLDERVRLAEAACADVANVTVEPFDGLLVGFCVQRRAVAIVKGIRNLSDMPDEAQMQAINADLAPGVETVFLTASAQWAHVSSSMVRWLNELDADISRYVPEAVAHRLRGDG